MNKNEVIKLSKLARIELADAEAESLSQEIGAILGYVKDINAIEAASTEPVLYRKNILRKDSAPHESGLYSESVLANAPEREGAYIKVKKILS